MEKRILVFPCGSEIGLEIYRALSSAKEVKLFGGSSVVDHGKYVYGSYFGELPYSDNPALAERLNEIIESNRIDYIFPAHDSTLLRLAEEQDKGTLACRVICPSHEVCRICRSKRLTANYLEGTVPVPRLYPSIEAIDYFPVFLKPDVGHGSKGTALAHSKAECRYYLEKDPSLLILEYLPGAEYTIDCFTDRNGKLVFASGRERLRISNGISVSSKVVKSPEFLEYARSINSRLRFNGAWFFQLKRNTEGRLVLMEVAPRIAGGMGLHRALGVNFALMSIYNAEGYEVGAECSELDAVLDSALESRCFFNLTYNHLYIDLDDCIILHGKVNVDAVKLLFHCRNRGIKIHLLTRHKENLDRTLSLHRLDNLFDTKISISDDTIKSSKIRHLDSIFIDDSFRERQEVHNALGVPVFAPDVIPSLLD